MDRPSSIWGAKEIFYLRPANMFVLNSTSSSRSPLTASSPSSPAIDIHIPDLGTVRGFNYNNYKAFIDIPYGQSTAGPNRWKQPLPGSRKCLKLEEEMHGKFYV